MWNEVILWLTQMMAYNAYIPLLIRQMNDHDGGDDFGDDGDDDDDLQRQGKT